MPDQKEPIDFNALVSLARQRNLLVSFPSETPEDAEARHQQEAEAATHNRRIHFLKIVFALCLLAIAFLWCIYMASTGSADDKKWAQSVAFAIVTGVIGYAMKG